MVDSRSIHPESVIDLASRKRERSATGAQPYTPASPSGTQEDFLSLEFLNARLESSSDQLRMWAAYHLVDRWQDECEQFVDHMFASGLPEVRESAINLIGRYRLQRFAFPLLRLFTSNDDGLRPAAGIALAKLKYAPAVRGLQHWYERNIGEPEASTVELESAVESLLYFDNRQYWIEIYRKLAENHQNHINFALMFKLLCGHAESDSQVEAIVSAYGKPREIFHDFHLTGNLAGLVGRPSVALYVQSRVNNGYPIPAIYNESLKVLDVETGDEETAALIERLSGCNNSRAGMEEFLAVAHELLPRLITDKQRLSRIASFLRGCESWVARWEDAILKVREAEYFLLLSLPLVAILEEVEADCLANPESEAVRISRIYQSPLLSPGFMRKVLNLLAHRLSDPELQILRSTPLSGWLRDEEKDTLWKLFTQQLDDVDYPFEQALPQPWDYRMPALMERLNGVLMPRFETYLATNRPQAVDYCLEVFRRVNSPGTIDLLLKHFHTLITHHYDGFIDIATHLPDERFLDLLLKHFREGENDLEQLIKFICDVHDKPYPELLHKADEQQTRGYVPTTVRLYCSACGCAYQYALDSLYVDLERIEQRQMPTARDLWVPDPVMCKKCGAPLPFEPPDQFLQDLYAELLATRILHVSSEETQGLKSVQMIPFPVLEGRTLNPRDFLMEVERALANAENPGEQVPYLLELGRFYLELGNTSEARNPLQKILNGPVKSPHALYYMGVISFQEKNLYEARVHFSRLIEGSSREDFETELDNPVDMAQHYLKLLDKREFKRLHFQIVSS